jgi:DNA-binding response OmpR family regulator
MDSATPQRIVLLGSLRCCGKRVLRRAAIINQIWHWQEPPGENTIKSYIKTLRAKLRGAEPQGFHRNYP